MARPRMPSWVHAGAPSLCPGPHKKVMEFTTICGFCHNKTFLHAERGKPLTKETTLICHYCKRPAALQQLEFAV